MGFLSRKTTTIRTLTPLNKRVPVEEFEKRIKKELSITISKARFNQINYE
jgi:hypothetical protein